MSDKQLDSIIIKEHDFQEAKNSLKKYIEQSLKEIELSKVPNDGGLFNLWDHKVTGTELNNITLQISNYISNLNDLIQNIINEFEQVYKAFESLDKDYISGIVASIKAIEKVNKKEEKDREAIIKLVEQHEKSVIILKKFKTDIDKIKHLIDVDKLWNNHQNLIKDVELIKKYLENHYEVILNLQKKLDSVQENQILFSKTTNQYFTNFSNQIKEQTIKIIKISEEFENEKKIYNEKINILTQKIKFLFFSLSITIFLIIINFFIVMKKIFFK